VCDLKGSLKSGIYFMSHENGKTTIELYDTRTKRFALFSRWRSLLRIGSAQRRFLRMVNGCCSHKSMAIPAI
jgi:hypothetical protein